MDQPVRQGYTWRARLAVSSVVIAAVATLLVSIAQSASLTLAAHAATPRPEDVVATGVLVQGGHAQRVVKYRSGVETLDGAVVASTMLKPKNGKTGNDSDDYKAFVANHFKPVVVNPADMVISTSGAPTEITPTYTLPDCFSPPAGWNIAKASDAELAKYGFPVPPKDPAGRAVYNQKQGAFTQRVCQTVSTNKVNRAQGDAYLSGYGWAGYIADQDLCSYSIQGGGYGETGIGCAVNTPNHYTELDTDYSVPCVANGGNGIDGGTESAWIGLGGTYNHNGAVDELIQTGSETDEYYYAGTPTYGYWTWWEYVNPNDNPDGTHTVGAQAFNITNNPLNTSGSIACGTHIYARVDGCNHMELGNLNTGKY